MWRAAPDVGHCRPAACEPHSSPHAAALLESSLQSLLVQPPANEHDPAQPVSSLTALLLLLLLELLPSCPWCNVIQIIDSLEQMHTVAACNIQQPLHAQQLRHHRHYTCLADSSCCRC